MKNRTFQSLALIFIIGELITCWWLGRNDPAFFMNYWQPIILLPVTIAVVALLVQITTRTSSFKDNRFTSILSLIDDREYIVLNVDDECITLSEIDQGDSRLWIQIPVNQFGRWIGGVKDNHTVIMRGDPDEVIFTPGPQGEITLARPLLADLLGESDSSFASEKTAVA